MFGLHSDDFRHHAQPLGRRVVVFWAVLHSAIVGGCASPTPPPKPAPVAVQEAPRPSPRPQPQAPAAQAQNANHDPCAIKLHDLCGPLLLYYGMNSRLPQSLNDLKQLPGFPPEISDFNCPLSKLPYTYLPEGVRGPDDELLREAGPAITVRSVIVMADSSPAHGGFRWAISISEGEPGKGMVAKVIVIPPG